jgi:hypothetical protein
MKKRKEEGKRAMLNVNIADKRTEDYRWVHRSWWIACIFLTNCTRRAPTPPPYVAFGGEGSSLGKAESGGKSYSAFIFIFSSYTSYACF